MMAFAKPEDLQRLVAELADAANSYNPSPDLVGFKTRVPIIETAKKIAQALAAPADKAYAHCLNVSNNPYIRD
jgi:hypothetical protein